MVSAGDPLFQGLRDRPRLFVNLLEHEVTVLTAFHGIGRQIALANRARGARTARVQDADRFASNLGDIAFLQEHEAARHRQQRGDIGGDEVLTDAEADDDGAPLARDHDAFRIGFAHHRQCVGPVQLSRGFANRCQQIFRAAQVVMNPVRDHFGIGFRREDVAQPLEAGAQRGVILDDAVVDDRDPIL